MFYLLPAFHTSSNDQITNDETAEPYFSSMRAGPGVLRGVGGELLFLQLLNRRLYAVLYTGGYRCSSGRRHCLLQEQEQQTHAVLLRTVASTGDARLGYGDTEYSSTPVRKSKQEGVCTTTTGRHSSSRRRGRGKATPEVIALNTGHTRARKGSRR